MRTKTKQALAGAALIFGPMVVGTLMEWHLFIGIYMLGFTVFLWVYMWREMS